MANEHRQKWRPQKVAAETGFSVATVMRALKSDPPKLKGYCVGPFGPWYCDPADVQEWVESMANTNDSTKAERAEQQAEHAARARAGKQGVSA